MIKIGYYPMMVAHTMAHIIEQDANANKQEEVQVA